jgi:para-aminobenzoate synthetase/4-amino-4-deoxychorismate lyase
MVAPPEEAFRARFAVAIRTVVVDRKLGTAVYGVGSGITWDSDAAAERAEIRAKAAVLTAPAGDSALLETIRWTPADGFRNLQRHLARLVDSADWFGFACDPARVLAELDRAVAGRNDDARVRLTVDRAGTVGVEASAAPAPYADPVTLVVDDEPVDSGSAWLRHKTTRRDVYRSRAERHPAADDVVLVNERGELTETTIANLAVRLDGTWWTPPTSVGCLPGVERARLLEAGVLHERVLRIGDLRAAEGIAVVNSLRGWRGARCSELRHPI